MKSGVSLSRIGKKCPAGPEKGNRKFLLVETRVSFLWDFNLVLTCFNLVGLKEIGFHLDREFGRKLRYYPIGLIYALLALPWRLRRKCLGPHLNDRKLSGGLRDFNST